MRSVLVLRPEPGSSATVRAAAAVGLDAVAAPLFTVRALAWTPPEPAGYDAVMFTSANALRHAGPGLSLYRHLPAYAVGEATAAAARDAGFHEVVAGTGDAESLTARIAQGSHRHVLHLCGEPHRPTALHGVPVYASIAAEMLPPSARDTLGKGAVALLHSPRAATLFASLLGRASVDRDTVAIAAISLAAARAAGPGWRSVAAAPEPTDAAMLAIARILCENDAP